MGNWSKQARAALSKKNYVQAGDFFKLDGNYRAAIRAYTKGKLFSQAAEIFENLGKPKKALALLKKDGSPKDLGEFFLRQGQKERAIEVFLQNGLEFEAAEMLERDQQFVQAAEVYERIHFHEKAGILYGKTKNFEKAIEMFHIIVAGLESQSGASAKAKTAKYKDWIANLHLGARQFGQAAEIFNQLNQKEKAAKAFLKAGKTFQAAKVLMDMGQADQAKKLLQKLPSVESRILLAKIEIQQNNFEHAAKLLKDTDQHELLVQVHEALGQFGESAKHCEKLGDLSKAAAMYSRGKDFQRAAILFEQQGQYDDAAQNYEKLKKFGHAAKLYHLSQNRYKAGYCLYKINRLQDALQQLQELDPEADFFPEARKIKAEIFYKLGNYSVARSILEEITAKTQLDDTTLPYFYILARCHEECNDTISARKYYERILSRRVNFADTQLRLKNLQSKTVDKTPTKTFGTRRDDFSPHDLTVGDLITNRFRIIKTLGKGGMGYIFKVRDLSLDRDIALKMLLHDRGDFEELKAELVTARDLTHPYIIKVFDIGQWQNIGYFTMEYVEGHSLKNYIINHNNFPIPSKIKLLIKICVGLNAAHTKHVVHRDIKPQNIIVDTQNNPKILDFGIARKVTQVHKEKGVSGSPKYMAPEQIRNLKIDMRTDIYALGIIMFYMFTIKEPFLAKTAQEIMHQQLEMPLPDPVQFNPHIPLWLVDIINKCCQKDPNLRYNNMSELIEELNINLMGG